MRSLILSDLHGNWEAMAAVLKSVRREQYDSVLVLGDLVGYGASPRKIVDRVRRFGDKLTIVRGNHDKVVAGIEEGIGFNPVALASIRWTRDELGEARIRELAALPVGPKQVEDFLICHGSPSDEDLYILDPEIAGGVFDRTDFNLCFFGHTHVPCRISLDGINLHWEALTPEASPIHLSETARHLVNVGSVGQPRDRDPRAAFVIYDSSRRLVDFRRVEYPIARAQRRIRRAGLPPLLADRLALGL